MPEFSQIQVDRRVFQECLDDDCLSCPGQREQHSDGEWDAELREYEQPVTRTVICTCGCHES